MTDDKDENPLGYWLVTIDGRTPGRVYRLQDEVTTLGALESNDVVLTDSGVSQRHGGIRFEDGVPVYRDFGSAGGSTVNGRLMVRRRLAPGDVLGLGPVRLRLTTEPPSPASPDWTGGGDLPRSSVVIPPVQTALITTLFRALDRLAGTRALIVAPGSRQLGAFVFWFEPAAAAAEALSITLRALGEPIPVDVRSPLLTRINGVFCMVTPSYSGVDFETAWERRRVAAASGRLYPVVEAGQLPTV